MMTVEFDFEADATPKVLAGFFSLPDELRPTFFSDEEDDRRRRWPIADHAAFAKFLKGRQAGFFLFGPNINSYTVMKSPRLMHVDCEIEHKRNWARTILEAFAPAEPLFGFACDQEEHSRRNQLLTKKGINSISSNVGRDLGKYLPGLYWMTLISDTLARQHLIPLDELARHAIESTELAPSLHLFRFYQNPEDWETAKTVDELISTIPGIFDIETIRGPAVAAKSVMDLCLITREWR